MRIAPLAGVKARPSVYLDEAGATGPIVITRNGKAVAVLLSPASDDDLERILLSQSKKLQGILGKSRQSLKSGHGLARSAFWQAGQNSALDRSEEI